MGDGSKSVGLGLIGCGRVVAERHLPALQSVRDAEVVALADINPDRLGKVSNRFHIENRYVDYRALLEHPAVEAVGVCVPTRFHAEVALAALDAGKHLFVEKPVALSLNECDRLIERAARSTNKVMVGFNMRWHRLVLQAREIVREGTLGPLRAIGSVFTHSRSAEKAPEWTKRRQLGGGVLVNEAVHHFDLWRFFLQGEVDELSAISQSGQWDDETVTVTARMANGALASALFALGTSDNNEMEIYGRAGRLRVSCYQFDGLQYFPSSSYSGDIRGRLQRIAHVMRELPQSAPVIRQGGDWVLSFQAEWRHFIDCIQQDTPPESTLEDGRSALQVVLAAVESASLGKPVQVAQASREITPVAPEVAVET